MGLFDVLTGDPAKEAAAKNDELYRNYLGYGLGTLNETLPEQINALKGAYDAYAPLSSLGSKYSGAGDMLLNALGVNGASGNAAATSAYHSAPGFTFARDQGLDAITRAGNAARFSGNTMVDAGKYATGFADQDYNNWLANLNGLAGLGASTTGAAASGQAGAMTSMAGTYGQNAEDRVNIYGNATSGNAASNTQAANAVMQGSANFWNGLMSLGGNIAKAAAGGGVPA